MKAVWPYAHPPSRVVYIGIDPLRFENPLVPPSVTRRALGIPDGIGSVIGSVGTLTPLKGQEVLLKAAALVRKNGIDAAYVLVGSGAHEVRLKGMCRDLGIADRVWFTGDRMDVENLYHIFDILVSTSETEGFGRVLAEAMAARRPVIATRAGGTEEVVEDGKTGMLLPQGDPGMVAAAITQLLRNPAVRAEMGEAGRGRVLERFSLMTHVQEVAAVFDQVMAGRGEQGTDSCSGAA
jgi:glycosyltransferase involved in cell wall biosynthesis